MNIYGNDGNLIFAENNYEIIESFNDSIKIKTKNDGIYIVKLTYSDGMDVKVMPNEIDVIQEETSVTIDGRNYKFVTIDGIDWLAEDIKIKTTQSFEANGTMYYAKSDIQTVLSKANGWRLPTLAEDVENLKTKNVTDLLAKGYTEFPNATNSLGLTLKPTGRYAYGNQYNATDNYFWSATVNTPLATNETTGIVQKDWDATTANLNYVPIRLCRTHV